MSSVFIKRVSVRNYKSIEKCSVELSPFTIVVGPNGSGKSNFFDVLRFMSEAVRTTLGNAVEAREGIEAIRHFKAERRDVVGLRIDFRMPGGDNGFYAFEVGGGTEEGLYVRREECLIESSDDSGDSIRPVREMGAQEDEDGEKKPLGGRHFVVENGLLKTKRKDFPVRIEKDRLYLQLISNLTEFREIYDLITNMGFYSFNPEKMSSVQRVSDVRKLDFDGANIAGIIRRMGKYPEVRERFHAFLNSIIPDISISVLNMEHGAQGARKETLHVSQKAGEDGPEYIFGASGLSEGTLRSIGVLAAGFQVKMLENGNRIAFIGIEEPEIAVHPAAAAALTEALMEVSDDVQVLLTTHSPDLLDHNEIAPENVITVFWSEGASIISAADEAGRSAMRESLYTAGELLKMGQLRPDIESYIETTGDINLFSRSLR